MAEPLPDAFPDERREANLASIQAEIDQLRAYKAEAEKADRIADVAAVFTDAGLSPAFAAIYTALNPDEPTPQDAARFAAEYGLPVEQTQDEHPEPRGFTPTVFASGTMASAKMYDLDEYVEVLDKNPAKAMQIRRAGRVRGLEKRNGHG